MSHQECVKAFFRKGASNQTLNLIAAFLSSRRMTVKVYQKKSSTRPIHGGSPQGCVSANSLFCATIEDLQNDDLEDTNNVVDNAILQKIDGQSALYAGETILGDVVSFEDNGFECGPISPTQLSDRSYGPVSPPQDFAPKVFSSPNDLRMNYSSHVTESSVLSYAIDNDSIPNRHQAGFQVWNLIYLSLIHI